MNRDKLKYTERSARVFRKAGIFVPIILIAYGYFIQIGIIDAPHIVDITSLFALSFWWISLGLINFFTVSKSRLDAGLRLLGYHILVGSYLIFVSGITSPFIGCWLLLMLVSYIYSSKRGLQISILIFGIVIGCDIYIWHDTNPSIATYDLVALAIILMIGVVILSISRSQEIDQEELKKSKDQELLQRDRVLTIINNMTDAVLSTDKDGVIQLYNAASLNLLDTNEGLNGRHIDEVLPLTDQKSTSIKLFKEIKKNRLVVKRDDLNYTFNNDEKMRLELTYSPIRSSYSRSKKAEKHDGFIIIMRDITKAKSLEEERDEFISVISHELRTPITIAEGTLSNTQIMMDHPDVTISMLKGSVNMAHDQILFLANMVNDISALSRAERGVGDKAEEIDIQELAKKLHDKYLVDAKTKKLHLNLDISPKVTHIHTSRLYLEETLQNFITNAIKYTKEGSITIVISQKAGNITFAIKDTGIGISKSDQGKIFEKFYRSEDYRTRETGGTGLGLYVAAKLANKIDAKINVTSRLNFGSTFSLTLPESSGPEAETKLD